MKHFKYEKMTCVTQKIPTFHRVIWVYPIDIQRERAGLLPPLPYLFPRIRTEWGRTVFTFVKAYLERYIYFIFLKCVIEFFP